MRRRSAVSTGPVDSGCSTVMKYASTLQSASCAVVGVVSLLPLVFEDPFTPVSP